MSIEFTPELLIQCLQEELDKAKERVAQGSDLRGSFLVDYQANVNSTVNEYRKQMVLFRTGLPA